MNSGKSSMRDQPLYPSRYLYNLDENSYKSKNFKYISVYKGTIIYNPSCVKKYLPLSF